MTAPQKVELSIGTTSQVMPWDPRPAVVTPKITMNGTPIASPAHQPSTPTGWQLVVIDATKDMTNPASILLNHYISLFASQGSWSSTYTAMYKDLVKYSLVAGNIERQLVIAVSYGLDDNMTPTNEALSLLIGYGAGAQLQSWELTAQAGSQSGGSKQLVANPVNYILVGYSAFSYGQGKEVYDYPRQPTVRTNLTVTLSNPTPPPGDAGGAASLAESGPAPDAG